jgi:hypothetical protein
MSTLEHVSTVDKYHRANPLNLPTVGPRLFPAKRVNNATFRRLGAHQCNLLHVRDEACKIAKIATVTSSVDADG